MDIAVFDRTLELAKQAGMEAHEKAIPRGMTVVNNQTGQHYHVPEGMCGFAWVTVYGVKGNTRLGKHMLKNGFTRAYQGGLQFWVSTMSQSVERKEAYAASFAKVLRDAGLTAYPDSRLD